jgi:ADP-ribose pyrophosphatase YjhB (NUDIX family)
MEIFKCPKGCCNIIVKPYVAIINPFQKVRRKRRKAGVLIYDPTTEKILIIQSKGHLWGPPKGTLNCGENENNCAVREVKEETGLEIDPSSFTNGTTIKNRAIYFYTQMPECEVTIQDHIHDNDANAISWIKLHCLSECIEAGHMSVTQHCRIVLQRLLGITLPHSTFICAENKNYGLAPLE